MSQPSDSRQRQQVAKPPRQGVALDLRLLPTAAATWAITYIALARFTVALSIATATAVVLIGLWLWAIGRLLGAGNQPSAVVAARLRVVVSTIALPASAMLAAVMAMWARRYAAARHEITGAVGEIVTTELSLTTAPEVTQFGSHASARIDALPGQVRVFGNEELLAFDQGTVLRAQVAVKESDLLSLNGLQVRIRGEPEVISAPNSVVFQVRNGLREGAEGLWQGADKLLPAMTVGDERLFNAADRDMMTASGLSHLSAVSGANIALVLGAVMVALQWASPKIRTLAAAAALVSFVAVVGTEPSVLRAALTGSVSLMAIVTGRPNNAITALSAGVVGLVLAVPDLAVSVGFMLSVAATVGLVLLAEPFAKRLKMIGLLSRWPAPILRAVAVAIVAHCVTAPVLAITLGTFAPWSVVANLLAAPAVAPVTILGSAAALFISISLPAVAMALLWCAAPFAWWIYVVAEKIAALPGGSTMNASDSTTGTVFLFSSVALTELSFLVLWLWPQNTFRVSAVSAGCASCAGAIIISLGLHIPRAPDGWLVAVCPSDQASRNQISRQCSLALGIAEEERDQVQPAPVHIFDRGLDARKGGARTDSAGRDQTDVAVVGNLDDSIAAEHSSEGQLRLVVALDCSDTQRTRIVTPQGVPVVCPMRDGPQALYADGTIWRGG